MSRLSTTSRVSGDGFSLYTNWRYPDDRVGSRIRPISETPPAPSGYTPQVMMVC